MTFGVCVVQIFGFLDVGNVDINVGIDISVGIDIDLDVDLYVDINIDVSIEVGVKVNVCDVDVNVNFYLGNVGIEVDSNDGIAKGIVGVQLKFVSLYDLAIALIGLNFGTECAFICPRVLLCHR